MSQNTYAVMKWLDDGDKLSSHHLRWITTPKKPWNNYEVGDRGAAMYPGAPGEWQYEILAVGASKKDMDQWIENFVHEAAGNNTKTVSGRDSVSQSRNKDRSTNLSQDSGSCCTKKSVECSVTSIEQNQDISSNCSQDSSSCSTKKSVECSVTSVEQKEALVQKRAQKDLATEILAKRTKVAENNPSKMVEHPTHYDCVSRKEFQELKDEVRRLKKRLLPPASQPPAPQPIQTQTPVTTLAEKVSPIPVITPPTSPSPSSVTSLTGCDLFNGQTRSMLEDAISHMDKLYPAVKTLLLKLFPEEYILTHSVSGKASNRKTEAKPHFDTRLYGVLVSIVSNKFNCSTKEITEKVHSVQKYLQKQK